MSVNKCRRAFVNTPVPTHLRRAKARSKINQSSAFPTLKRIHSLIIAILALNALVCAAQESTATFEIEFENINTFFDKKYNHNSETVERLKEYLSGIRNNPDIEVKEILINGYTSLESTHEANLRTAHQRRKALENIIRENIELPAGVLTHTEEYIDWDWLREQIAKSNLSYKDQAIAIINQPREMMSYYGSFTRDKRIYNLHWLGKSSVWNYMEKHIFPQMRKAVATIVTVRKTAPSASTVRTSVSQTTPAASTSVSQTSRVANSPVSQTAEQPAASKPAANEPYPMSRLPYANELLPMYEKAHQRDLENIRRAEEEAQRKLAEQAAQTPAGVQVVETVAAGLPGNGMSDGYTYGDSEVILIETADESVLTLNTSEQNIKTIIINNDGIGKTSIISVSDDGSTVELTPETIILKPGTLIFRSNNIVDSGFEDTGNKTAGATGPYCDFMPKGSIKTNVAEWALMQINLALDFDFGPHWSLSLPFSYSGWNYFRQTLKFRTADFKPEIRYWPSAANKGFYLGLHPGFVWFNYAFDGDYRYANADRNVPAFGGGLGLGYRLPISHNGRWNMEFGVGAGVYHVEYAKYRNVLNGNLVEKGTKTYFGLDGVNISFAYSFNLRK